MVADVTVLRTAGDTDVVRVSIDKARPVLLHRVYLYTCTQHQNEATRHE